MFPIPKYDPGMVKYFKELIESGVFRPLIDRRYPLDQIVEAYKVIGRLARRSGQRSGPRWTGPSDQAGPFWSASPASGRPASAAGLPPGRAVTAQ